MRAVISEFSSPDVLGSLRNGPKDLDHYSVLLEVTITSDGDSGGDVFHFNACSSSWVEAQTKTQILLGHSLLIQSSWDFREIERVLRRLVESIVADSWQEIVDQIRPHASWEFEGYRNS